MKRVIISMAFLSAMFVVGCNPERSFDDNSFGDSVVLSSEVHDIGVEFTPDDIWVVRDSMVVVNNPKSMDSMIMIINGSSWELEQVACSRAQGYLKPTIVKNADNVMLYDQPQNRMALQSDDGSFRRFFLEKEGVEAPSDLSYNNSTYYYQDTPVLAAGRIIKLDDEGNRTLFHDFTQQMQETKSYLGYNGSMAVSPNGERVAYGYRYLRRFDIFKSNGSVVSENIDPAAPSFVVKEGGVVNRFDSTIYYDGVAVSDECVYLYYIGRSTNEIKESSDFVTYVESFDWDGKPLKRYELGGLYSAISYMNGSFVAVKTIKGSSIYVYKID